MEPVQEDEEKEIGSGQIIPAEFETLDSSSPFFRITFDDSSFGELNTKNLDLVFAGSWYWRLQETSTRSSGYLSSSSSIDKSNWIEADLDAIKQDYYKSDIYNEKLNDELREFVLNFKNRNYVQGLRYIDGFSNFNKYSLRTEKIYSSNENNYFVYKRENGDSIYFDFETSSGWVFKPLDLDREVDWIKIDDVSLEQSGEDYDIREGISLKYRGEIENFESFKELIEGFVSKDLEDGLVYLFSQNPNFGEIEIYSTAKILDSISLKRVIDYLEQQYNEGEETDVSILVRQLSDVGHINQEEFDFITGKDSNNLVNFPEDMIYVIEFLELKKNLRNFCSDLNSINCYIDYTDQNYGNTGRYTTHDPHNRVYFDYLYINGIITEEEYNSILPSGLGQALYNAGKLVGLNPEKGKTFEYLKEILEDKKASLVSDNTGESDVEFDESFIDKEDYDDPDFYEEKWKTYEDVLDDSIAFTGEFSTAERGVFLDAESCNDCGGSFFDTNSCDRRECYVVGLKIGKNCEYKNLGCREE